MTRGIKMTANINGTTIKERIKRGWTREDAENTPLLVNRVLTIEKVLELEPEGLSINSAAYVLGVLPQTLWNFLNRHGLPWRGKRPNFRKNEKNPDSMLQKSIALGVCNMTIHKRIERFGCSYEEAAAMPIRRYTKINKELIIKAIKLKELGMTLKDIAELLNCDDGFLSKKIKAFNHANTIKNARD